MQAREDLDKMLFLLYLCAGQHFSLPLGLIEKEMLYVGAVAAYYRDFWNSSQIECLYITLGGQCPV